MVGAGHSRAWTQHLQRATVRGQKVACLPGQALFVPSIYFDFFFVLQKFPRMKRNKQALASSAVGTSHGSSFG